MAFGAPSQTSLVMPNRGSTSRDPKTYADLVDPSVVKTLIPGQRQRMNLVAICQNLFLPWLFFCSLFALLSFAFRFDSPTWCFIICSVALLVVVWLGAMAYQALRHKQAMTSDYSDPTWYVFLFLAMLVAWILAIVFGEWNFRAHLRPYYEIANLNSYPALDVSKIRGQQVMDAGRVIFTTGTVLDLKRSMGFKNLDKYCVAPIVPGGVNGGQPLTSYDYWAVGINCCSADSADFACGEYKNVHAHAGVRYMGDEERQFLRLAVQQAESTYNIRATHPLFFEWMQDPDASLNHLREEGYKYFMFGMFGHFIFNLVCVILAVRGFSKLGPY